MRGMGEIKIKEEKKRSKEEEKCKIGGRKER